MHLALLLFATVFTAQDPIQSVGTVVTEMDSRIWCIHEARDGDMWFGSNGAGVYHYDGSQLTQFTDADGLVGTEVRSIDEDSQGRILVGTYKGISLFDGTSWTALNVEELPIGEGWELNTEDLWLVYAPGTGGPCRWDGKRLTRLKLGTNQAAQTRFDWSPARGESAHGVYSVHRDRRGHIWFGTAAAGLCRFDGASLQWMYETHLTTTPSGGEFGIRSIYQDHQGDFWICNTRHRYSVAPEAGPLQMKSKPGLPKAKEDSAANFTYFPSILQDDAGTYWIACGGDGVWSFDGKAVQKYTLGEDVYTMRVVHDQQGRIWAGTIQHGVFVLGDSGFKPFEPVQSSPVLK